MKYILPFVLVFTTIFISCRQEKETNIVDREKAEAQNDSILNAIYNNWNYNIPQASTIAKNELADWQNWNAFVNEINQKPIKSISALRSKVENLTRISDELLSTLPVKLNQRQINSRLNNLNANIKHLNSFITLNNIPVDKVIVLNTYIRNDINSIFTQIEEVYKIKNIPTEKGENSVTKTVIDTARRANFDFEKILKTNQEKN